MRSQPLTNAAHGRIMTSRPPSVCSSSGTSTYLAQDPMHQEKVAQSPRSVISRVSLCKSINTIALECLKVGDVTVDEDGTEWLVRPCYCGSAECCGKSFRQIEGKEGLDSWDKGRPLPQ
jgi:hypothetical protein